MSVKLECDRCGRQRKRAPCAERTAISGGPAIVDDYVARLAGPINTMRGLLPMPKDWDLCPECAAALVRFLEPVGCKRSG
jgi:hypothetical protein